jgi:hypothetical protein
MTLTRAARGVEKAAEIVAADAWLVLSDGIDEREAALAEVIDRRRELGVSLSSAGKITRTMGGLVQQLIADPEAPLPV